MAESSDRGSGKRKQKKKHNANAAADEVAARDALKAKVDHTEYVVNEMKQLLNARSTVAEDLEREHGLAVANAAAATSEVGHLKGQLAAARLEQSRVEALAIVHVQERIDLAVDLRGHDHVRGGRDHVIVRLIVRRAASPREIELGLRWRQALRVGGVISRVPHRGRVAHILGEREPEVAPGASSN